MLFTTKTPTSLPQPQSEVAFASGESFEEKTETFQIFMV
jgi:hypothetical protein